MSEEKNIDRLFQERFKDFEATPSDRVWTDIQTSLDKKKRNKRVIPLWWRVGGIAAALALLLSIGYTLLDQSSSEDNIPAVTNTKEVKEKTTPNPKTNPPIDKLDAIVFSDKEVDKNNSSEEENTTSSKVLKAPIVPTIKKEASNEVIASEQKDHHKQPGLLKSATDNAIAITNKTIVSPSTEKNNFTSQVTEKQFSENKNTIAQNTKETPLQTKEENTDTAIDIEKPSPNKDLFQLTDEQLKKAASEAIAETVPKKQSLLDVAAQQQLKELDEEAEIANNEALNKWSVNPTVAPVYYNTIGQGSPIHSQFKDNDKNGELNLSYGVHIAYAVNSKISVRSGINNVTLGYGTNDVAFTPSVQATGISTIDYRGGIATMDVADNTASDIATLQEASGFENRQLVGTMNQKLSYLEIPLEVKYRVIDRKLGLNLIAGASSLFLTDNSISVSSDAFASEIGEANNINKVSFSTNIGLGVDYKLNDKFQVNLEPMFKYQVNTFSDNEGNFKPYILGIYTGVSYQF